MRKIIFYVVSLTVIAFALGVYLCNIDIYKTVGNMAPVSGYNAFIKSLYDEEFVLEHYQTWGTSDSWVLMHVYEFLTGQDTLLNSAMLLRTQAVIFVGFYYALVFIPFCILMGVLKLKARRHKHECPECGANMKASDVVSVQRPDGKTIKVCHVCADEKYGKGEED